MPIAIDQAFPPTPSFTEKDIPDLTGKVAIVTGSSSGVGFQSATILYSKNATVYLAARSSDKAAKAITAIKNSAECAGSLGTLKFLSLDLSDLGSIKGSAQEVLRQETRLDILIHNAGVMRPPAGSTTNLGHDLEMGTNCLGPFTFNDLLLPLLKHTAASAPKDSVRVVWLSSVIAYGVVRGGFIFDDRTGTPAVLKDPMENYMQSKVGNVFLASEMARRMGEYGILSLSVNPGLMKTELQRHAAPVVSTIMGLVFKPPRYGAYSELFAALSPQITASQNGAFIIPWGRLGSIPPQIKKALLSKYEGGAGVAERFWDWCEKETAAYRKRGLQCVYIINPAPPPRNAPSRSTKHLQLRIRHLEELVNSLRNTEDKSPRVDLESESQHDTPEDVIASSLGKIHVGEAGMSYVSGAHWTALQDSIADLKDCLETGFSVNQPSRTSDAPALLIGLCPLNHKDGILELIPQKNITDRLVSRFFNSMEPGVVILHAPTFQEEYNRFWENQHDASLTWLSLLFSIMNLAIFSFRTDGELTSSMSNLEEREDEFRLQAAYCLIRDKYTKPSKYTIEALLLYGQTEYVRSPDAQYELWVVFGVAMRLAMRVGLHRDGSRYPGLSSFEVEMRRRIWSLMSQLDSLFSFQMGLPRMIHKGLSDTKLPRNLLDSDFNEQTTTLPPSRPDTDFTAVSYLIAKGRIAGVFGLIADHVMSTLPGSYQDTVQLDQQLNEAYAAAPSNLQFRGVDQSVTELPVIIIGRYNLDILYQKARCVLHRNYLHDGRSDTRGQIGGGDVYSKEELLSTLYTSRQIWSKYKENSVEALQAWRAITVMLQKLDSSTATTTQTTDSHHISSKDKQNADVDMQFTSPQIGVESSLYSPPPANLPDFENSMSSMTCVPEDFMMDNNIWDFSNNIDWLQWDAENAKLFDMTGNRAGMSTN
ncbi:hypothetical protein ZTR_01259 [Talaromyces verruculosus]|nr:hypothetical protein ZTR_01259 [Talaromyces verruculosus]